MVGFEVFELNAVEILNNHKRLCTEYGFTGLIPFDTNVNFTQNQDSIRQDIFTENIKLISECDIIIANMNTFRGEEVDQDYINLEKELSNKKIRVLHPEIIQWLEENIEEGISR